MNDELKELAKQVGISFGGHPMNPLSVYPSQLEKFAELIIDECFKVVNDFAVDRVENDAKGNLGESLYVSMKITETAWKIKEHFRIKK